MTETTTDAPEAIEVREWEIPDPPEVPERLLTDEPEAPEPIEVVEQDSSEVEAALEEEAEKAREAVDPDNAPEAIEIVEHEPREEYEPPDEGDAHETWPGTEGFPNDPGYTNHQAGQIAGYYLGADGTPDDFPPEGWEPERPPAIPSGAMDSDDGETVSIDDLTVDELKAELDARGIEYASTDRKADLQQKLAESS